MLVADNKKVLALCGGVGGAKLALGFKHSLPADQLTVVVNTGDDFEHLGLTICPDLDTVMYTLAGLNDAERGWGLAGETWNGLAALERLGGDTWFQLGDQDLATHLMRSQLLAQGYSLSAVTGHLCRKLEIDTQVLPMSDDPVRTLVGTEGGELAFQHYFVRDRCKPAVTGFRFDGIGTAQPHPEFLELLQGDALAAIVICPSNPFVSVQPILALPGVRDALRQCGAPVVAVSPIVAGLAIKGPAAKMMEDMSMPVSAAAVAGYYGSLLDGYILDEADAHQAEEIESLGIKTLVVPTVMQGLQDRIDLAESAVQFSRSLVHE
ncbi:2-phospho-L-lactate transferase [Microbulbifer sp. SAOS-129_SWC]|uniref:2-phospho-L-lactate transferase n=1 Tax=Microbulbifer sp. SAOS-129_SWC TaxID=3145235 RepID=UPI00321696D9